MAGSEAFRNFLMPRSGSLQAQAIEAEFFRHGPTRGVAREEILRRVLAEILPQRWGLATGQIHTHGGAYSGQVDLVVYDQNTTPKLHELGASAVLPIEAVAAVISVNSSANASAIDDATAAASLLRRMPRAHVPLISSGQQQPPPRPDPAAAHPPTTVPSFPAAQVSRRRQSLDAAQRRGRDNLLETVSCRGRARQPPRL